MTREPGRDERIECPDAETLAAWTDEGLGPEQRSVVESHVADCARCQMQLAAMTRMASAEAAMQSRDTRVRLWRWLVPATAAATALAIWVSVQPNSPDLPTRTTVPTPATPQEVQVQARDATAPSSEDKSVLVDRADRPPKGLSPKANQTVAEDRQRAERSLMARLEEKAELAKERASAEPKPADLADEQRRERVVGNRPASATAPAATARTQESADRSAMAGAAAFDVVSTDLSVRWRVIGSLVRRSIDRGATWDTQSTGVSAQLAAGSSPSASVCWLVGRGGVILLSTDGRTWRKTSFPEAVDLVGVAALDAARASVTTVDGRILATSNGGTTWVTQ